MPATAEEPAPSPFVAPAEPHERALGTALRLEVEHVRALAQAGFHTLEHIALAVPESIGHALREWANVDAHAVVAEARRLLHLESPATGPIEAPNPPASADWWRV